VNIVSILLYRGYTATLRVELDDGVIFGRVDGIRDGISFHAERVEDLRREFELSVDAYLEHCWETGREPQRPYSGDLPFHTTPETHRAIVEAAVRAGKSVTVWMEVMLVEAAARSAAAAASVPERPDGEGERLSLPGDLSAARGLVERMGGHLEVTAVFEDGTVPVDLDGEFPPVRPAERLAPKSQATT
jgi:predicted HicB family RNase H-like nuclease